MSNERYYIHALIPCTCGCKANTSWNFEGEETTLAPMWPISGVPGKTVVYHCYSCGCEVEKKIEDVRCDAPTEYDNFDYHCDSSGEFSWKCPQHGIYERSINTMIKDPEIYRCAVENGFSLCCAEELIEGIKRAESARTLGVTKCIACNRTLPMNEVEFFPHIGDDDCPLDKLPICSSCWYDHDDFYTLEDNCGECDQCTFEEMVSPSSYDTPDSDDFKRLAVQNVAIDEDGDYLSFELVCTKSGTILAEVQSHFDSDDDFDFDEEFDDFEDE